MTYWAGVTLVILAGLLWSLQGLVFRQIEVAGAWQVLFWRSMGMLPGLVLFLAWRAKGSPWPALRAVGLSGAVGGLGLVAAFGGAIVAIQSTTIANAVFLFAVSPFLTAFLGWAALGERVGRMTWITMAIALFGVYVMVNGGLQNGAVVGNVAALVSALGFAVFTVTLSGGMLCYTLGSRVVPAAQLALLSNVEVFLAPFWVWLFLGETAMLTTLIGGAILLVAVTLNAVTSVRGSSRAAGRA